MADAITIRGGIMAQGENVNQDYLLRLIAEANQKLARLQRERMFTMSADCLPAYDSQWRASSPQTRPDALTIDSTIASLLAGEFDAADFVDSERAEELELIAESFARQLRLYRKRLQKAFDVFLCHNSNDKREVRSIEGHLKRRSILPWIDEQEIRPGTTWQSQIQNDIESIRSCAVVVGPSGLGPWQKREVDAILQLFVERGSPVIPVILPSCRSVPELPLFLKAFGWVDYRTLDPDPLERLIWGISGGRSAI
jgi:hypothetical protein